MVNPKFRIGGARLILALAAVLTFGLAGSAKADNVISNSMVSRGHYGLIEEALQAGGGAAPPEAAAGVRFVERARVLMGGVVVVRALGGGNGDGDGGQAYQSAADAVNISGVTGTTMALAGQNFGLGLVRFGETSNVQPAYGDQPGDIGLWASPFYRRLEADGLKSGGMKYGYDTDYHGGSIGADVKAGDAVRLGLAATFGRGDSETNGRAAHTENDFDFWGLTLYGSYTAEALNLVGDVSYLSTSSDVRQLNAAAEGGRLKADIDSRSLSLGLTGEYRIQTGGGLIIVPNAGVRHTRTEVDDHQLKDAGGAVFRFKEDQLNTWTFPVGVGFTADIQSSCWTISPRLDLGAIFAAGDRDATSKARIPGLNSVGVTTSEVVDAVTFNGAIGLKAKNNYTGLGLALDYNFQKSDKYTGHAVTGVIRYDFD